MVFAIHWHESAKGVHVLLFLNPPSTSFPSHPSGSSQYTGPEHHVSSIEPGLVIYFTYGNIHVSYYSLKSSHPCLLPQSPKVCSLHLCLFCCLAYRVIVTIFLQFSSSVQFSRSVVSNSLEPHESQHTRPPCPSPTLGVHSDSRPSSQWCHPTISSSVVPFSSCLQYFPASGSFPIS